MNSNQDGNEIERKYISFFQSVTTIGVITKGKCLEEASDKAIQMVNSQDVLCSHFNRTPFSLSETSEWESDIAMDIDISDTEMHGDFLISGNVRDMIATKLGKTPDELTQEDCTRFILHGVHNLLFHREPEIGNCKDCRHAEDTHHDDEYYCEETKSPVHKNHKCGSFKRKTHEGHY